MSPVAYFPCHLPPARATSHARFWLSLLAGLLVLAGCGTSRPASYVHPNFDFSRVKKVAVLPLENLTSDQTAGEKMRKVVITELLATGIVDVIEPGQVNRVLANQNIQNPTAMSPEE